MPPPQVRIDDRDGDPTVITHLTFRWRAYRQRGAAMVGVVLAVMTVSGCTMQQGSSRADPGGFAAGNQAQDTSAADSLLTIADKTLASGDVNSSIDLYRQSASTSGDRPEALIRLGQILFSKGDYDHAVGAFAEALSRRPSNPEALRGLGVSQLAAGRLEDAERSIEQAVRQDPNVGSIKDLAVLRMLQGQPDEARMVYQKALARWPQDLSLKSNFAISEALGKNCQTAIGRGQEAAMSPFAREQNVAVYALVLALCGQEAEAKEIGSKVMSDVGMEKLLQQAAAASSAADPAIRAAIIGVVPVQASGVMAPEGKLPLAGASTGPGR
jgi:Flp pilus assembly protein TadD